MKGRDQDTLHLNMKGIALGKEEEEEKGGRGVGRELRKSVGGGEKECVTETLRIVLTQRLRTGESFRAPRTLTSSFSPCAKMVLLSRSRPA